MRLTFLPLSLLLPALAGAGELSPPTAGRDPIELRVMVMPATFKAWPDLVDVCRRFEEENPGVRIALLSDLDDHAASVAKVKMMIASKAPIDVVELGREELPEFYEAGLLLDLEPLISRDPTWDTDDFFSAPLDSFRGPDGHLYGLPDTFTPYVMYYNKDLFDAEGVPYPKPEWTWEDFRDLARKLTHRPTPGGRPERFGVCLNWWPQAMAPWIWQNGGDFLTPDSRRCVLDSPEAIGAVQFLRQLFDEQVAARDSDFRSQLKTSLFQAGKVALYGPSGYWELYRFQEIRDFRWDICLLPKGPKGAATAIALGAYAGIGYTQHPDLTYKLLRRLASDRGMSAARASIGNGIPGFKKTALSEACIGSKEAPASRHVYVEALDHARFLPATINWREVENLIQADLDSCLKLGTADAGTACRRIAEKVNAYLDRERQKRRRPLAPLGRIASLCGAALALGGLLFLWRRGPRPSLLGRRQERAGYAFIALWASGFLLLSLWPLLALCGLSLTEWTPTLPLTQARWAGAENYTRMLTDERFWAAIRVTSAYALLSVPLSLALGLALALLSLRRGAALRAVFYLPAVASPAAIAIIWNLLLGDVWRSSVPWIIPGFALMSLWGVGGYMLVFLAGLQGIDPTLYEAARLDGASPGRQLLHVTLPQLTPLILFNLVVGAIAAFQVFAQPLIMTNGGPANASLFYLLYLYWNAFLYAKMGYAAALSLVLLLILLAITALLLRSSRRWVHYEGEAAS